MTKQINKVRVPECNSESCNSVSQFFWVCSNLEH